MFKNKIKLNGNATKGFFLFVYIKNELYSTVVFLDNIELANKLSLILWYTLQEIY